MSHGNKGSKGKGSGRLPVIPGLPMKDDITEEDLRHIGQYTHIAADRGSMSRFSVPTRAKARRREGEREPSILARQANSGWQPPDGWQDTPTRPTIS